MVKIEFTEEMLWRVNDLVARPRWTDTGRTNRLEQIRQYLKQQWAAELIYDYTQPLGQRRYLRFRHSPQALEFVLKYA